MKQNFNKKSREISSTDRALLHEAARTGDNDTLAVLLDKHPEAVDLENTSFVPLTPLQTAAWTGQKATVELLLERGANIDKHSPTGSTALTIAIAERQTEIVKLLLDKGASIEEGHLSHDGEVFTPLMQAVRVFDIDTIKLLLERGADVNKTYNGKSIFKQNSDNTQSHMSQYYTWDGVKKALAIGVQIEELLQKASNNNPPKINPRKNTP